MFTDTHAHLYAEEFAGDRDQMVKRAIDAGVNKIFLPNIDLESIEPMLELVNRYPNNCFPTMGLHPCSVGVDFQEVLSTCRAHLEKGGFYGVGETGIDLFWDKTFIDQQKEAFRIQIDWAKEFDLPLIIHARDSFDEIFEVLDKENDTRLRGVFHCFTGNAEQAKHVLSYKGFLMGIGGVVTFKNSGLDKVLETIPLSKLVLETDAPYLAPVPNRGKRNETAFITAVASRLSQIFDVPVAEIAEITSANAKELFRI